MIIISNSSSKSSNSINVITLTREIAISVSPSSLLNWLAWPRRVHVGVYPLLCTLDWQRISFAHFLVAILALVKKTRLFVMYNTTHVHMHLCCITQFKVSSLGLRIILDHNFAPMLLHHFVIIFNSFLNYYELSFCDAIATWQEQIPASNEKENVGIKRAL